MTAIQCTQLSYKYDFDMLLLYRQSEWYSS